jgi:outer membrane immunogenic protein
MTRGPSPIGNSLRTKYINPRKNLSIVALDKLFDAWVQAQSSEITSLKWSCEAAPTRASLPSRRCKGQSMRTIWLAIVALTAFTAGSFAQTVERRNDGRFGNSPPVAASSWSGFYLGLGLGFRATRTDAAVTSELVGPQLRPADLSGLTTGQPIDGLGFRASPYFGYNWQFAPRWVTGVEGDVGFARQTSVRAAFPVPLALAEVDPSGTDILTVKATWDASLRGRLGFLVTPSTLAYATGGVAWQHYDVTSTCGCTGIVNLTPKVLSDSTTKAGWTVGGGLETVLWGNWLARAEYRYADFGTSSLHVARAGNIENAAFTSSDNVDVRLRTHTATFGLAYKFGEPIVGDGVGAFGSGVPANVSTWSGLYAGLALGARASQGELTTTSVIFGHPIDLAGFNTSQSVDGTGFRGSPYLGFNWQFMPRWLVGIEGDAGFANQTTTLSGNFSPLLRTALASDSTSMKTTWDASLRGRIGILLTPATLAYATGGVAWQHYEVSSTCVSDTCASIGASPAGVANSTTKAGWTLGGGLETALWHHWLARAEYRYADFGSESFAMARTGTIGPIVDNYDVRLRAHTLNFGLAYKFN